MSNIAWSKLMRLGLVELRLSPEDFWNLSPAELMMMLGVASGSAGMSRSVFAKLTALYPDEPKE